MLHLDVVDVEIFAKRAWDIAVRVVVVCLGRDFGFGGDGMCPFCDHIPATDADMAGTHLGAAAIVPIAVQAERLLADASQSHETRLVPYATHRGPPSIGQQRGITTEALAVNPVIGMRAERPAVAADPNPANSVPPPPVTRSPFVSFASFVMTLITPLTALAPHSVAPGPLMTSIGRYRRAAHLARPKHPRKQRCVDGASIDEDQELVGGSAIESAGADGPLSRVDLRNLQIRCEAQRFRKTRCPRLVNIVLGDDLNRRGRLEQPFRAARHGHNLDVHQFIEAEVL